MVAGFLRFRKNMDRNRAACYDKRKNEGVLRMFKRIISLLLVATLLMADMLPALAWAAEGETLPEETTVETVVDTTEMPTETTVPTFPETEPTMVTEVVETLPMTASQEAALAAEGSCGEKATWSFDGATGTLTISGTGRINNYVENVTCNPETFTYQSYTHYYRPWQEYNDAITKVVVERGITMIGSGAFSDCVNLTSVSLPDTLGAIGMFAFHECSSLSEIEIPAGVQDIGEAAFHLCTSLSKVNIPDGVNILCRNTFRGCSSLREIQLPELLFAMEEAAFAFSGLKQITIPASVREISDCAFLCCEKLGSVTLQEGITKIGREAFSGCGALSAVTLPDRLTAIGDGAFAATALERVRIPAGVTELGEGAFPYSQMMAITVDPANTAYRSIDGVLFTEDLHTLIAYPCQKSQMDHYDQEYSRVYYVPEGVEVIGENAFRGAYFTGIVCPEGLTTLEDHSLTSGLNYIVLPKSLKTIGYGVFENGWKGTSIDNLQDIYFGGTALQWNQVTKGGDNRPLDEAVIHYDAERSSGHCRYGIPWSFDDGTLTIHGSDEFDWYSTGWIVDFASPKDVPWYHFRNSIRQVVMEPGVVFIGEYAFSDLANLDTVVLSDTLKQISSFAFAGSPKLDSLTMPGSVTYIEPYAFDNCPALYTVVYKGTRDQLSRLSVDRTGNEALYRSDFIFTDVTDYIDNSAIEINYAGGAYAYYFTAPNSYVKYTVNNGDAETTHSNADGVLKIPLGDFSEEGTWKQTIAFLQVGGEIYDTPLIRTATVTVTPLTFSQKWKASFDAEVAASIGAGVGASIGVGKLEATLGKAKLSIGGGRALTLSRTVTGDKERVELISDAAVEGGATLKSGITGESISPSFEIISVSAGATAGITGTYGIVIEDYTGGIKDSKLVGTFLLGEVLAALPNNVIMTSFYRALAERMYLDSDCSVISGSGVGYGVSAGVKGGNFKVNGEDLFSVVGKGIELSFSAEETKTKAPDSTKKEKEVNYKAEENLSFLISDISKGLGWDILGRDTTVKAVRTGEERKMEANYLSAEETGIKDFFLGKNYTAEYHQYTFREDSLEELIAKTDHFGDFVNGSRAVLTVKDMGQLADFVNYTSVPMEYSRETKDQVLYRMPLMFGVELVAGLELGVDLAYLEATSYTDASGYAEDGSIHLTGESEDLSFAVESDKLSLGQWMLQSVGTLKEELENLMEKAIDSIEKGVDNFFGFVKKKGESAKNWLVSLVSPKKSGSGGKSFSYQVDVASRSSHTEVARGILEHTGNYELTKASTVGMPVLVSVTDGDTGAQITDLSEEPLEFGIRYTEEDLKAAGLSSHSAIIQGDGLALYRYSDEGDYFEYIGGSHDREEKTVTAEIGKTGQYILAVDSCAPQLRSLDLSDFRSNPTITAYVDDLSGLDTSSFVFKLDGELKVDGKNIANHYDSKTGLFTYTVENALAEGEHTLSFTLADTSGNTETYEYTFRTDLTAPEMEGIVVTGFPNAGSGIQVRAKVTDENLTGVYAVFSKRLEDGSWSAEAAVEMGALEDGVWALDYEGDGSSIKVFVRAVDFAGNSAVSETYERKPFAEEVTIGQDYLALYEGQEVQLAAEVKPAELSSAVQWSVEPGSEDFLSVDETGNVTALQAGTGYVLATVSDGEKEVSARCRIDVAESLLLDGVQLDVPSATTELYSTDYAKLHILLKLPQNYGAMAQNGDVKNAGVAITRASFVDWAMEQRFDLVVRDDRSLLIVPTTAAVANPDLVGKKYVGPIAVTIQGNVYYTEDLTLTVKKTLPKLKATIDPFNSFWSGQRQAIAVSGATVTGIEAENLPDWLYLHGTDLVLTEKAPAKNASAKVNLLVETAEWRVPVSVALGVKNTYKVPGLKLSASSVQLSSDFNSTAGAKLTLQPKNKKDTLAALGVSGIVAGDGYTVSGFDAESGVFTLTAGGGAVPGKTQLEVRFSNTDQVLTIPLTVKLVAPTLKLSATTVNLNPGVGDSAAVTVTTTPADYVFSAPSFRLQDKAKQEVLDTGVLDIQYEGNVIRVSTTEETPSGQTYKLYISAGGSKEVALTIKTVDKAPAVKLKQTGDIDLSFPANVATITPAFTNYGGKVEAFTYSVMETKSGADVTAQFKLEEASNGFSLSCTDAANVNEKGAYTLNLKLELPNGETLESSLKLKVKRTALKLKLSAAKLTLNKAVNDSAAVTITCTTKGYEFTKPVWDSIEGLDLRWNNGKLQVSTNADTQYGATYKVNLRAEEAAAATVLTVVIPAETKSAVTSTLKLKGNLDTIRDGSSVIATVTYKNCAVDAARTETLIVVDSDNADVTNLFNITRNSDGTFTIQKAKNAILDTAEKYQVKLVTLFSGTEVESKPVKLTVKMGTAKLTAEVDGALFAKDKHSRLNVRFTSTDAALNGVARVEIKDTKYKDLFEVFDYGNGEFALGVADGTNPGTKPINLTLNVFLKGNGSTKENASVKVKVSIIP